MRILVYTRAPDTGHCRVLVAKSKVYHVISKRRIVFRFHGGKIVALMNENIMREIWMSNSVAAQPVGISQYSAMVFV